MNVSFGIRVDQIHKQILALLFLPFSFVQLDNIYAIAFGNLAMCCDDKETQIEHMVNLSERHADEDTNIIQYPPSPENP